MHATTKDIPVPSVTGLGRIGIRGEAGPHPLYESLACLTCSARKSDICGGLDNTEIRELASGSHRIQLKPGETLVWDGDAAQYSYVITRGTLRAQKASGDGRRQILDFLFSGQFIGIPSDQAYHFDAEALTDAEVCRFDRRKLEPFMLGLSARAASQRRETLAALRRLRGLAGEWPALLAPHDVLIGPTLAQPAPPLGHLAPDVPFDEAMARLMAFTPFTGLVNAAGAPAISLPLGRTKEGVPIGVHALARHEDEATLLALAAELEEAMPWPRLAPRPWPA